MDQNQNREGIDTRHCRRKEAEYSAMARATTDPEMKIAYEALAREYAYKALLIREVKKL